MKELLQQKAEAYDDLEYSTLQTMVKDFARWNEELEKENKELKERVTELEGVIAKLSQKVINESNY